MSAKYPLKNRDNTSSSILDLRNISFYRGDTLILDNVNLKISKGEHWVLMGPNGCGKTTLIDIISAYLWPSMGSVEALGGKYGEVDVREIRKKIGIVSSALYERMPCGLTLGDVIVSGAESNLGLYGEQYPPDREKALETAVSLGIGDIFKRKWQVLSFGQRQLALLGRSLMAGPGLLILDEPCEGLDIGARELVLDKVDSLASSLDGPTVIFVTHRIDEIPLSISHALILKEGRVLATGEKEKVLNSLNLSSAMGVKIEIRHENGRYFALTSGTG